MSTARATVRQLPERLSHPQAYQFFYELQPLLKSNRAYVVFDFSDVREIDSAGVGVLLRSLEEVMKGNGDLKLAAVSAEAGMILQLTGVDRLFEIFETTLEAVESFHIFPVPPLGSRNPSPHSLVKSHNQKDSAIEMGVNGQKSSPSLEAA
jgi:anti-sigma B factor antagonist